MQRILPAIGLEGDMAVEISLNGKLEVLGCEMATIIG